MRFFWMVNSVFVDRDSFVQLFDSVHETLRLLAFRPLSILLCSGQLDPLPQHQPVLPAHPPRPAVVLQQRVGAPTEQVLP